MWAGVAVMVLLLGYVLARGPKRDLAAAGTVAAEGAHGDEGRAVRSAG
jgi:hypothetical protein